MKNYTPKPEIVGKPTLPRFLHHVRLTNSIALLALLAILTTSCQSNTGLGGADNGSKGPNIQAMMAPFAPKTQTFQVSGQKPSVITGKAGTKIHVEPQNLTLPDGSPIQGKIEVSLIECTQKSELLGAGLQTVSDGKLLESGGSYYIDMQADGQKLAIKEGKTVEVDFPKVSGKKMELFYGAQDERGQMNWDAADVDFKPAPQKQAAGGIATKTTTTRIQTDTMYVYGTEGGDTMRSSNMEDVVAFMNGYEPNLSKTDLKNSMKGKSKTRDKNQDRNEAAIKARRVQAERNASNDQTLAEQQAAQNEQSRIDRANANAYASANASANASTIGRESRATYVGVNLDRFGWYNCDRFMGQENTTLFTAVLPAPKAAGIVYFVLKNTNSIIQMPYVAGYTTPVSAMLPLGQKIEIFVVEGEDKDGKMDFAKATATVKAEGNVKMECKSTPTASIKTAFDSI